MKLRIPNEKLTKAYDELIELSHPFSVDLQQTPDAVIIEGDENDIFDFLIAYHDIDMAAAKEDMSAYVMKNAYRQMLTPEVALQTVNDFILAKGGFEGYDAVFEILNNAIHGI